MELDPSRGWNAVAQTFIDARSANGAATVRRWATQLPQGGCLLDVGCGSGIPITAALIEAGFEVFGIDASPALVAEFRRHFPSSQIACEPAETSRLFDRKFDGAVSVGLLFLLPPDTQRLLVHRISRALKPGGRFLFSAPREACEWKDSLTGQTSLSLGENEYRRFLEQAGMRLTAHDIDEGKNSYFDAERTRA